MCVCACVGVCVRMCTRGYACASMRDMYLRDLVECGVGEARGTTQYLSNIRYQQL